MKLSKTALELLGNSMVQNAAMFAARKHAEMDHLRKYVFTPYIVHCAEVAQMVASVEGATPTMVAAAYLHDTLEDTETNWAELCFSFGQEVADLVHELSDAFSDYSHGNREKRKRLECERSGKGSPESQTIKCLDCISNITCIMQNATDNNYKLRFIAEMAKLHKALDRAEKVSRDAFGLEVLRWTVIVHRQIKEN